MLNFTTPSLAQTLLTPQLDGPDLYVTSTIVAASLNTFTTKADGSVMTINPRFTHAWHAGETATPFAITVRHQDGTVRADMVSATFTLVNALTGVKLIDAQPCEPVLAGVLAYRPTAPELASPCLFRAQYKATLDTGHVLPTFIVEGEILANL